MCIRYNLDNEGALTALDRGKKVTNESAVSILGEGAYYKEDNDGSMSLYRPDGTIVTGIGTRTYMHGKFAKMAKWKVVE